MKRTLFLLVVVLTMSSIYSSLGYAETNSDIPDPDPRWSFEEHEEWHEKYYDDWREQTDYFKTDEEIKQEISGDSVSPMEYTYYMPGDILVTNENTTVNWNHGHAALVQDAIYTIEIYKY